ncbi:MAG TPA: malto-oligosyltrehalose trehalohydrolase [Vicinamibacterales bacterium]
MRGGATHFRVWAPAAQAVTAVVDGRDHALEAAGSGYFEGRVQAGHGARYGFKLDDGPDVLPDPASRFQPEGPHGLSQVIDPSRFAWRHAQWTLAPVERQIVYEMHIGTFTAEGTWEAAAGRLPGLKEMGVTALEIMPVAEFPGSFNWGYDGVQWFAPFHGYGTPDSFRAFVDAAHALDLAVILDVVYNHFGPDGNYMSRFAPQFFSKGRATEWGEALNFDGEDSEAVRQFVIANARYWTEEFRLDGFRIDAVQQIFDSSDEHIVAALVREARAAAGARPLLIFGEHEPQHAELVRAPEDGGWGLDAIWNDDFHHAAGVALTGARFAYYADYAGTAREFVACARHAFLYQGQHYPWQKAARGRPALDIRPSQTVGYLENHDQVANSTSGARLHERSAPGAYRAMTALLLLGPWVPLLLQGQEFGSTRPFLFFADHHAGLAAAVEAGRREFLRQFRNIADEDIELPRPHDRETFERCVLDEEERRADGPAAALHRDLMRLRADDPVIGAQGTLTDGATIDPRRFVLRMRRDAALKGCATGGAAAPDRLLVVNLGAAFDLSRVSEPLVAPPASGPWRVLWHSERPHYEGSGMPPLEPLRWEIPGQAAVLLGDDA